MHNGDEASPSIILAGRALLVKMLITLEPHGIFAAKFVHLCILTLSSHCYAKGWRGFVEHHFGRSSSFSEKAHNSWTLWYIHFKFCILMYFNIVRPFHGKRWRGFAEHHFGRSNWLLYTQTIKFCPLDVYVCRFHIYARIRFKLLLLKTLNT